jgi:hypothetical protein
MGSEVPNLAAILPLATSHTREFKCFCGAWFLDRTHFDIHIRQHPGKFVICDCCNRTMPTGPWGVDRYGNFVPLD